jgi:hypothetical protein
MSGTLVLESEVTVRSWIPGETARDVDVRTMPATSVEAYLATLQHDAEEWQVCYEADIDGKRVSAYRCGTAGASNVHHTWYAYGPLTLMLRALGRTAGEVQRIVSEADSGRTARVVGDALTVKLTDYGYRVARIAP